MLLIQLSRPNCQPGSRILLFAVRFRNLLWNRHHSSKWMPSKLDPDFRVQTQQTLTPISVATHPLTPDFSHYHSREQQSRSYFQCLLNFFPYAILQFQVLEKIIFMKSVLFHRQNRLVCTEPLNSSVCVWCYPVSEQPLCSTADRAKPFSKLQSAIHILF